MPRTIKLPDAMPEITSPTLLVVCDAHHCKFIDAGGHTLIEKEDLHSKEAEFSDRQGSKPGPGSGAGAGSAGSGKMVGVGDMNPVEANRLKEFANVIAERIATIAREQNVGTIYLSAPGKFLSLLKERIPKEVQDKLEASLDGNFVKESAIDLLIRFRPDLKASVQNLRDQENYSSKKHLPK